MKAKVKKLLYCRACNNKKMHKILSLGKSPLANSFLKHNQLKNKEDFFPLDLILCKKCGLVQLADIVDPNLMFKNYLYVSSTSKSFIEHFKKFANDIYERFDLNNNDLVIDVGSNDGILLKPFKKLGTKTLGVDPAKNVARIARKSGINTIVVFFDQKVARKITKKNGRAKIITATNVFAHTHDWVDMIKAVKTSLENNGVFIIEAPYLLNFIKKNLFDTVYH